MTATGCPMSWMPPSPTDPQGRLICNSGAADVDTKRCHLRFAAAPGLRHVRALPLAAFVADNCHDRLMMTKAEYLARAEAEDDWAPGWLAIDAAFDALYPGITPPHQGTPLHARAILGGTEYIDGYSTFPSPNGYQHLLTYGMSKLYVDEESFGGEFSGWGYEMTMKVRANGPGECRWAVNSLSNLGRYTYTSERWFEPFQFISGRGQPLRTEGGTRLTSYVTVPDTEAPWDRHSPRPGRLHPTGRHHST
jgi:hypothetical protein